MKRTILTLCAVGMLLLVNGCSGDDSAAPPSATLERGGTTSTTLSAEAEVEAAYLRSWDVYTEAMRTFDASHLADVYADAALKLRTDEVAELKAANTPGRMSVEHNVKSIEVNDNQALLRDEYVNHSVLLGPDGTPTEADPNTVVARQYLMVRREGAWKVADVLTS